VDSAQGDGSADLNELIQVMSEAASAFIGGRMRRYFELMNHTEDFTLMPPTGGDTIHGQDPTDEVIDGMAHFFKGGEATLEVAQTYASGDLAVLVAVERQHGEVGDYPVQDWSLRVTLVFRREAAGWRLAHRHADALVHPISFDQVAALARG
jgi:ketosteroid isomerase-like protein